jgi:hypothetical protein
VEGAATAAATLEEAHTADAMANVGDELAQMLELAWRWVRNADSNWQWG